MEKRKGLDGSKALLTVTSYVSNGDSHKFSNLAAEHNSRLVLNASSHVMLVDGVHIKRAIAGLIQQGVISSGYTTIDVYYASRGNNKRFLYLKAIKLSRLAHESTGIVRKDTHFQLSFGTLIVPVYVFLRTILSKLQRQRQ